MNPRIGARRDHRRVAILAVPLSIALIAALVTILPGRGVEQGKVIESPDAFAKMAPHAVEPFREETVAPEPEAATTRLTVDPTQDRNGHVSEVRRVSYDSLIAMASDLLRQGEANGAADTLRRAMFIDPDHPAAFQAMGDVMMQRGRFNEARDYFESAIDRDPLRADAYFNHATASEAMGDLESAMGGMRSFLHVAQDKDPFRLKIAQARSALWEWEAALGRGPWGPTHGVPPGFTEAELKRDGKGVGVKMPIAGTEGPDGLMKYEIKHGDKIKMFEKE